MIVGEPVTHLEPQFSSPGAMPTPWVEAIRILGAAEIYWLSTVRPDGRPHVTPLIAVWQADALYFCTGQSERKAENLEQNPHCVITTGCNALNSGIDIVLEGEAQRVTDESRLQSVADQYSSKYNWHFVVRNGGVLGDGGNLALVFRVTPKTAFGFGKGEPFSQTRWRF